MPDRLTKKGIRLLGLGVVLMFALTLMVSCAGSKSKKTARAHYDLGRAKLSTEQYQAAFVEFQKSLGFYSRDKEVHNAIGIVYLNLEDLKEAEKHFKKAARLDSKYSEAHNNLCFVYFKQEKWADAEKSCQKALKNPLYVTPEKAYYNLGSMYYKKGDYSKAIEAYTKAVRRNPIFVSGYYGLALSYNAKELYGDAANAMQSAVNFNFKGDKQKAAEEFRRQLLLATDRETSMKYTNFLEILKY